MGDPCKDIGFTKGGASSIRLDTGDDCTDAFADPGADGNGLGQNGGVADRNCGDGDAVTRPGGPPIAPRPPRLVPELSGSLPLL